ncbi:MAG: methyltransferase domain-containing protein [Methylococcaceae bacterium]|nr:methyltransferase domain-containing protein [Methylococcaceae bacterium]
MATRKSNGVRSLVGALMLQAVGATAAEQAPTPPPPIPIVSGTAAQASLVHVGGNDTFAITPDGRRAGTLFYEALKGKKKNAKESALQAIELWDKIIPQENYGGEYTALQWFATYFVADPTQRDEMLKDPFVNEFFHLFADNKYAVLKEYINRKYHVEDIGDEETYTGQTRKAWLEDTILFNNPRREEWERTSQVMELIDLKPGDSIADIGSGPGYYTFRFAQKVGPTGKVYAIDTVEDHLKYVGKTAKNTGIGNIDLIHTDGKTLGLADAKVDAVFMCSLYHNIYAMSAEPERVELVESIKSALKDDGTFYLVDNGLVPPGTLPYHGPYIAKELIIQQLTAFGFKLVQAENKIPQRYILIFKKQAAKKDPA